MSLSSQVPCSPVTYQLPGQRAWARAGRATSGPGRPCPLACQWAPQRKPLATRVTMMRVRSLQHLASGQFDLRLARMRVARMRVIIIIPVRMMPDLPSVAGSRPPFSRLRWAKCHTRSAIYNCQCRQHTPAKLALAAKGQPAIRVAYRRPTLSRVSEVHSPKEARL
jgi:hypothetical protein